MEYKGMELSTQYAKRITITSFMILFSLAAFTLFHIQSCVPGNETKKISIEVHEGTELAFDLSPNGQTIVFDLLGQIWLLPVEGGDARAITDSVNESAEHLHPTFSPDGQRIVFWESRPMSWGLSSMNLEGEERRNLTEYDSDSDIFHACSPKNGDIVFVRGQELMIYSGNERESVVEIKIDGLPHPGITDPVWTPDGNHLVFVNANANRMAHRAGRLWRVEAKGGTAEPLTPEKSPVRAPAFSPDGRSISYFLWNHGFFELWIQKLDGNEAHKLIEHADMTPLCSRWLPEGDEIIYSAEGRLWRISVENETPREIPFVARLNFSQKRANLNPVNFPEAELVKQTRGHMGFVLSPDGQKIAAIALGKLWGWQVGDDPEIITALPVTASCLCWSPDNLHVAWSAGITGFEDLFMTNVQTGLTRRLTELPGTETKPSWSPDGQFIAFIHLEDDSSGILRQSRNATLRVFNVNKSPVADLTETRELKVYQGGGRIGTLSPGILLSGLLWGPDSRWLLTGNWGTPILTSLDGEIRELKDSKNLPADQQTLLWGQDGLLLYQKNYMLWRIPFDPEIGIKGEAIPISEDPALYPSSAKDGSVLYVSGEGWRLRRPNGEVKNIGWPISFKIPESPDSLLISDVQIIDGTGRNLTPPRDILVDKGRIVKIGPHGKGQGLNITNVIEGEGRIVIPGLIDAHVHCWDQVFLPEYLYEGITTVREMGSQLAWIKGFQELVEAGVQSGPRIVLGGLQLGPSLIPSSENWNPYGLEGYDRVLSLAQAFDLDFIKMYWPENSYSGAEFIEMAHARGFPVASHFGYPLPLAAAGIDSKEHLLGLISTLGPRFGGTMHDDIVQLSKASGIGLIPTIDMSYRYIAAFNEESILEEAQISPFLNDRLVSYMPRFLPPSKSQRADMNQRAVVGRNNVDRFFKAGALLAAGTDYPFYWTPWMLHRELEQYVFAGMSPLDAIVSATRNAAQVLHADRDIGTIEEGKLADLLILDANPLENIRNTRTIWKVIQGGKIVERDELKNWQHREEEAVAKVGREK
jgi:Tol biopolymer transport system component